MGQVADKAQRVGQQAHQSDWLDHVARAGLVAFGLVHLMIAWLAVQLALGDRSEDASNNGALHALAEQPLGGLLIWLVAAGLVLLAVWMVVDFALGHRESTDTATRWRKRLTSLGKGVVYGALAASAVKTAAGSGSSSGGTDSTTARLMGLPGGQLIVGAVGLGIGAVGVYLIYKGWSNKFVEELDAEGTVGKDGSAYMLLGKSGHVAKGLAIAVVAGLFVYAAASHDPKKSGGLDQALQTVLEQPLGPVLLFAIALGIAAYGLFCFARAKHLSR
jgi:type IV secretory pathway VirB2 component (pilin)